MKTPLLTSLCVALLLSACGADPVDNDGGTPPVDSGTDAGTDAGPVDAGVDAGVDGGTDAGVDAGEPETFIVFGPQGTVASSAASFSFTSDQAGATFECKLDAEPFAPCTSPKVYSALLDAPHTFSVRALTATAVDSTPASRTWEVKAPPDTLLTAHPPNPDTATSATFEFATNKPNSTFECADDSTVFVPCTSPYTTVGVLRPGLHAFAVRAVNPLTGPDTSPATWRWNVLSPTPLTVRLLAGNLTSGSKQSYDPGEGIRIFQGLKPDVVMLQEFNHAFNSDPDLRSFVDQAFGPGFTYFREPGVQLPNGIISRYPIVNAGVWDDPQGTNREFVYAELDVPGPENLWVVSLHFQTTASSRPLESQALLGFLSANVPANALLALGGDSNTSSRTESAITQLSSVVVTTSPWPVDQSNNDDTSADRSKPYDWVLVSPSLNALKTPVVVGANSFPAGLVFDSRVYSPLADVAPVLATDSAAPSMQHMAVVKDFTFPAN